MLHEDFNYKEHGFVGHLAELDGGSNKAVIVYTHGSHLYGLMQNREREKGYIG